MRCGVCSRRLDEVEGGFGMVDSVTLEVQMDGANGIP